ncbi:MAG: hypothetical protein P9M03_09980 [Candidatus Theseobacter exili]|nr:hypothetical protein [Candidatus Theseobacter exili]
MKKIFIIFVEVFIRVFVGIAAGATIYFLGMMYGCLFDKLPFFCHSSLLVFLFCSSMVCVSIFLFITTHFIVDKKMKNIVIVLGYVFIIIGVIYLLRMGTYVFPGIG